MKKTKSKFIIWLMVLSILLVLVLLFGGNRFYVAGHAAEKHTGNFIPQTNSLKDGHYQGSYEIWGFKTAADIAFTIKDGKVESIDPSSFIYNTPGHGAEEEIFRRINKYNDLNFDAVTGATHTTWFARAAIKNAIKRK